MHDVSSIIKGGGNIFMDVNDILGNYETRYFGAGHKHTTYAIADVKKTLKEIMLL